MKATIVRDVELPHPRAKTAVPRDNPETRKHVQELDQVGLTAGGDAAQIAINGRREVAGL